MFSSTKSKLIAVVLAIGAALIVIFINGLSSSNPNQPEAQPQTVQQTDKVELISTNPSPLENATLTPNQSIELTFNTPIDETNQKFQIQFDPSIEFRVESSNGNKTLKITPANGFGFGQGYSLHIKKDNRFQGDKKLENDIIIHFTTTAYSGV